MFEWRNYKTLDRLSRPTIVSRQYAGRRGPDPSHLCCSISNLRHCSDCFQDQGKSLQARLTATASRWPQARSRDLSGLLGRCIGWLKRDLLSAWPSMQRKLQGRPRNSWKLLPPGSGDMTLLSKAGGKTFLPEKMSHSFIILMAVGQLGMASNDFTGTRPAVIQS